MSCEPASKRTHDDNVRLATAIHHARRLAPTIVGEHAQVADAYRQGDTHGQIVEDFELDQLALTSGVARLALQYALEDLIPDHDERTKLGKAHMRDASLRNVAAGIGINGMSEEERQAAGAKGGAKVVEEGLGIHSLSREDLQEVGRKCAKLGLGIHGMNDEELRPGRSKGGQTTRDEGLGIHGFSDERQSQVAQQGGLKAHELGVGAHALTTEQLSAAGKRSHEMGVGAHGFTVEQRKEVGDDTVRRKVGIHAQTDEERKEAGRLRALSIGRIPWEGYVVEIKTGLDEGDYCMKLAGDPEFHFQAGSSAGRPNSSKIARALNEIFNQDRKPVAVRNYIYRRRKKERA
ncbi:hypothetical protein HN748_00810 [Candidatus Peregrinibacteria bacterium]|jgi:hypothetical protein|nr:hypothetical protein [Candidatus Peregrinibacteria bacterium]MBT7484361.1 hypothetical protein [Candidatus Peregrinibacteria bacterium]MBT7702751.1 hypothetical protein [Candidatus Peregrinibacteria bacterium]